MFFKMKNKKSKKQKVIHLEKYKPVFITTDNVEHIGYEYKWFNDDGLLCSVPEYMMISIKSDGYLEDNKGIMYPLQNILSIDWKLIDSKIVADNFYHEWQVCFSDKEVSEMTEVECKVENN